MKNKILVVVGPTSSGKSELAVRLGKKFNGEIISCDSRQIYRGMDLGTGKVAGRWSVLRLCGRTLIEPKQKSVFVYKGIPHHLMDFVSPRRQYSAALFQHQAQKKIAEVTQRGRLPILCGGTGQWIDAVVYNQQLPDAKPNPQLRARLEKKSTDELFAQLKKFDPCRAANIDRHNKRRLIRALEIIKASKRPVPKLHQKKEYDALWVGIDVPKAKLAEKINRRLKQRLKAGLLKEVRALHAQGLTWEKLENFGLEYRYVSEYLQNRISYHQMFKQLSFAIKHYAKRQLTWWKKNKSIAWIKKPSQASKLIKQLLFKQTLQ